MTATVMLLAWATEVAVGWPKSVYRRIGHPVVWIGWLVTRLDRLLNRESLGDRWRRFAGALTASVVVAFTWALAKAVTIVFQQSPAGLVAQAMIASSLLATRSLYEHVSTVATSLSDESIQSARAAVSHIVGRDPNQLDEAGIVRAALESLAENASDGIVAPLFWGVIMGLPGIAAYKAINTLDSMIGHRNARYEAFGKFAARLDDAANWVPARLTGGLFALASGRPAGACRVALRDARHHRSVNAGWPEASLAGALDVRLSGPRRYGDSMSEEPWLNAGAPDPDLAAMRAGLRLYVRAMLAGALLLAMIAIAMSVL